jgi:hypothetical protein
MPLFPNFSQENAVSPLRQLLTEGIPHTARRPTNVLERRQKCLIPGHQCPKVSQKDPLPWSQSVFACLYVHSALALPAESVFIRA